MNLDWKNRYEAVSLLSDFAKKNSDSLLKSKSLTKYLDYYSKLLSDSNIKVSSFAITSFTEIIPIVKVS